MYSALLKLLKTWEAVSWPTTEVGYSDSEGNIASCKRRSLNWWDTSTAVKKWSNHQWGGYRATEDLNWKGNHSTLHWDVILHDTGWDIPTHMRNLSMKLSVSQLAVDFCFKYVATPLGQAFTNQECWISTWSVLEW